MTVSVFPATPIVRIVDMTGEGVAKHAGEGSVAGRRQGCHMQGRGRGAPIVDIAVETGDRERSRRREGAER